MLTKTRKWLLAVIALLCTAFIALGVGFALPWAKLFPTKTVQAETATTAVDLTFGSGSAGQDSSGGRYLLYLTEPESADISGNYDVKVDIYKNGVYFSTKAVSLYDFSGTKRGLIVPFKTLTGENDVTTMAQVRDLYVLFLRAGTTYSTYHVKNERAWSLQQNSVLPLTTNLGEISYGVETASAQDDNSRYLLRHTNTEALTGVNYYQLPMIVSKNGVETAMTFESYANGSNAPLTCISYAKLTGSEITTAAGVTDTYTLTLQKGSIIAAGNTMATVGKTIIWTINKYDVSGVACDIEITVTPTTTFAPRANDYYTLISYDQELGIEGTGSCKVPVEVTKDGDSIGAKQADLWLNGASYTKDNAGFIFTFTNPSAIDGFYTATLKKGTIFTANGKNVYVKNEVSWFMDPTDGTFWTVGNNYGKATLTSGAVIADDESDQYSVTTTSDVDLSKIKAQASLPMLVSKNGGEAETKNFTLSNNGTTTTVAFDYETLLGNKDAVAAEVTDTYTITLKKGTAVRSGASFALIANDVTWTIEPTETDINATATPGVASISADFSRYQAWITTGVDWASYGIVNPEVPFTVSKNGSEAYTLNFVLFNNGDDFKESQLILFEYSRLGSFTSAAENTDTYLITLEAGTQIEKGDVTVTFADTVTWYARGNAFGVVTADHGEVSFTAKSASYADNSQRYQLFVEANATLAGTFKDYNIPLSISKNGKEPVHKVFHVWSGSFDYTDSNTMIEVFYNATKESGTGANAYDSLGGTFSTAADNSDEYIATLKKGSIIYQNGNIIRVANEDISWYMSGTTAGVYNNTRVEVTLGTAVIEDGDSKQAWATAQDGTNGGRYGAWFTAKDSDGNSLADLTGTNTTTFPMTVYMNKGTANEKTFKMATNTVYSNDGGQGWNFDENCTFVEILYANLCAGGGASFTEAASNTDAYILVIEAGTPIALKSNGTLVVFQNDLSIYLSGSVGFVSRGDETVFSTMTSFKLDYTGNTLTEVKMRFRGLLSEDVYEYLKAQVDEIKGNSSSISSWELSFHIEVSNGTQTITLDWTWDELTANEVDTDGDGTIDGYAFSAVIGGLNGHWDKPLTAQAYIHFKVDFSWAAENLGGAKDIPATDCYFAQTSYSVNSLAEKYNEMGIYAEDQQLLDYLASETGL